MLVDGNENWVRNLSNRVITQDEKRILNKGLNFNVRNATNKKYLAELEQTLKSSTIPEDAKQTIRQIIVPALMRKGNHSMLSNREEATSQALMMSPRLMMERLQTNCQAGRTGEIEASPPNGIFI
ncbi:unnamed protein product [Echinostoma caproni]|uniref:Uncharacterized protein n=1 Tax=Echinostoma caproni TaxID=27848 RepID=A0A183BFA7_9TREM|nr:unnamed protein product [Echinostoma caproni]